MGSLPRRIPNMYEAPPPPPPGIYAKFTVESGFVHQYNLYVDVQGIRAHDLTFTNFLQSHKESVQ